MYIGGWIPIETSFLTTGNHVINYQFSDLNKAFSSIRTDTFNVSSCLPHGGRVISGLPSVCLGQTGVVYSIRNIKNADSYTWSVPAGAIITAGSNTNSITIDFSMTASPGDISVYATNVCGNGATLTYPIIVYPSTIAGDVTGGETIFFGMEATLILEGNVGSILKWQKRWNGGTMAGYRQCHRQLIRKRLTPQVFGITGHKSVTVPVLSCFQTSLPSLFNRF